MFDYYGRSGLFLPSYNGNPKELAEYLKTHGKEEINIGAKKQGSHTPLHFACYNNAGGTSPEIAKAFVETINILLENGAVPFALDNIKRAPIHLAANGGNLGSIKLLIEQYKTPMQLASLTDADYYGRTTIHAICSAAQNDNSKIREGDLIKSFELLLGTHGDANAALNKPDVFGLTPAMLAKYYDLKELFPTFGVHGIDISKVEVPKNNRGLEFDYFGRTELMRSAFVNETERAKRELENGADVMTSNVQAGYRNSLHLACGGISAPPMLLTFLSDIRTNPIGVDGGGSNGLHFVANSGRIDTTSALLVPSDTDSELVKLNKKLIRENINACDLEGNTALHACAMANSRPVSRIQVIVLLLTLGADKTITNNNGQTAQQLAESRNNTVIIDALNKSHQEQIASPVILTAFNNTTNSQQQTSVIATSVRNDATTTAKSMM